MKPNTDTPKTADLEPALRYLAANPTIKVSVVAAKFKLPEKEIWNWLGHFNGGKKNPLPVHRIEAAVAADKTTISTAVPSLAVGKASHKPVTRPEPLVGNVERWLRGQDAKITGRAQTFFVMVSPELAASWLLLNQGNRNPSKAKIRRFAASIKAGKWILNGETIKFSVSGRLLDGQSRLKAIVMAGAPALLEIRFDLPDAAQKAMDIGETRKGTHTLEMMGEKYPAILSPALRLIHRWENGALSYKGQSGGVDVSVLENMEIEPMLKRHEGLKTSVGWIVSTGYKVGSMMPPSEAAFFHYLFGLASASKRDGFFTALATGLGLTDKSPAYHLREKLQADRASSKRMGARERMAITIKAWNAHLRGEKMGQLGFWATGEAREAFPTIAGVKTTEKAAA